MADDNSSVSKDSYCLSWNAAALIQAEHGEPVQISTYWELHVHRNLHLGNLVLVTSHQLQTGQLWDDPLTNRHLYSGLILRPSTARNRMNLSMNQPSSSYQHDCKKSRFLIETNSLSCLLLPSIVDLVLVGKYSQ